MRWDPIAGRVPSHAPTSADQHKNALERLAVTAPVGGRGLHIASEAVTVQSPARARVDTVYCGQVSLRSAGTSKAASVADTIDQGGGIAYFTHIKTQTLLSAVPEASEL